MYKEYSYPIINKLNFGIGNAKLSNDTAILSLPAGHSCPFASQCRSAADKITGKILDGKDCQFRCYAATAEALFKTARDSRWENFEAIKEAKTTLQIAALIDRSIPRRGGKTKLVRFHQSGDFFNQPYFDAWLLAARSNPDLLFYGYTKALPFWIRRLGEIPSNFKIVASYGGTHDHLIKTFGLRSARVVMSKYAARKLHLPIDHDDTHVWKYDGDFAIVIHGTQPKGSVASKAWNKILSVTGKGDYHSDYFKKSAKGKKSGTITIRGIEIKPVDLSDLKKMIAA